MDTLSSIKGKKCYLTGGKGFIGKSLVKKLRDLGAIVASPSREEVDITNPVQLIKSIQLFEPEIIFHLAATGFLSSAHKLDIGNINNVNIVGTHNLVLAAKCLPRAPVVIMLGTCFEYKNKDAPLLECDPLDPFSDYGISKIKAADLARKEGSGLPIRWIRLFNCYGPHEPKNRLLPYIIERAKGQLPVELTAGEQIRNFTYVEDVAEGLIRIGLSVDKTIPWDVYNFGSKQPICLKDYIDLIKTTLHEFNVKAEIRYGAKPYRDGEAMIMTPDVSYLQKNINWLPTTPMGEGIKQAVNFAMNTHKF